MKNNGVNSYNILVVDEETSSLNSLSRVFAGEYNIFLAVNGKDALTIMNRENIALIMVGYDMPEITGVELLNKIWRSYPETIRIIITENTNAVFLLDAINKGHIYAYINKPWKVERIRAIVREGLDSYEKIIADRAHYIRHFLYDGSASGNGDLRARMNGNGSIGSILLKRGLISKSQLDAATDRQQSKQRDLGELLLELGTISAHDLEIARGLQKLEMKTLPETLVELGYISDAEILSYYALQLGMPYISLEQFPSDLNLIKLLPPELAYKYNVLPVNKLGKVVTLAASEPLSKEAQSEIEARMGFKVMIVGASHQAIRNAVKQCYPNRHLSGITAINAESD